MRAEHRIRIHSITVAPRREQSREIRAADKTIAVEIGYARAAAKAPCAEHLGYVRAVHCPTAGDVGGADRTVVAVVRDARAAEVRDDGASAHANLRSIRCSIAANARRLEDHSAWVASSTHEEGATAIVA